MRATERVRDGLRAVEAVGTGDELRRFLVTARRLGTLVDAAEPEPAGRGLWRIRAVLWATTAPVRAPQAQLAPPVDRRPVRLVRGRRAGADLVRHRLDRADRAAPPAATRSPRWSLRWPAWATGEVILRTAALLGAAAVPAAAGWLVWQAVEGAVIWTGQHRGQLAAAAVAAAGLWLSWILHRLRASRRRFVHHCPGCPHGSSRG